jgi:hypothetical protein
MGLDMNLYAKKTCWGLRDENVSLDPWVGKFKKVATTYEVAYWRKANHIHSWFVKYVQDGKDDCGEYYVSKAQLTDLMETVRRVVESPTEAKDLLPTQSGFFFGSTDYDDYYFDELRSTMSMLRVVIDLIDKHGIEIYYSSSW